MTDFVLSVYPKPMLASFNKTQFHRNASVIPKEFIQRLRIIRWEFKFFFFCLPRHTQGAMRNEIKNNKTSVERKRRKCNQKAEETLRFCTCRIGIPLEDGAAWGDGTRQVQHSVEGNIVSVRFDLASWWRCFGAKWGGYSYGHNCGCLKYSSRLEIVIETIARPVQPLKHNPLRTSDANQIFNFCFPS